MKIRAGIMLMLAVAAPLARGAGCVHLRVGYMDQHRPPYWMGDGDKVPNPPGASVDLIHDAAIGAGFGCEPTWVRLPVARLKVALVNGDIDMTTIGEQAYYPAEIALPRDKAGNIDLNRALHNTLVVLVRAKDNLPASTNPMQYFQGKVLGAPQGNSYSARLREAGLTVDEGGRDLDRNIEKLKLGRVDGVVVAAVVPAHLKATLDKYKGTVVQLPQPMVNTRLWLAFNDSYYRAHREQVEALWTWLDNNRNRLGYVMQKYRKQD
ncbi:transporter substrate-binding domain-containing protein [Duganella aceris]|uniref:Amino acid ABC transporter substrate-binding protein n=1 Tax=Duganella aceris TaxID=2703883 RepID=A0ABX0FI95_9BURK|nr:transporter substrate-binding domain-containing protein [Duganella aceris]NGZ84239.1 amino acid ABC transporter substrate-binding protein [Duganella aceris]